MAVSAVNLGMVEMASPSRLLDVIVMKRGIAMVREMVNNKIISKYRLAKEMNVSENAVDGWYRGMYFDEFKHLPRLSEIRERYMKAFKYGIYSE